MTGPQAVAVIPSRFGATRFPGKPLAPIAGKPMVQHVWERCVYSGAFAHVWVATDDHRIEEAVRAFGGHSLMTPPSCESGTARVAHAARTLGLSSESVVVNVQGDEPAVAPEALRAVVDVMSRPHVEMATVYRPLEANAPASPHVVKVVLDAQGDALYFSRSDIPHHRPGAPAAPRWAHVGLYAFRVATLHRLVQLPPAPAELSESLEQLRALHWGIRIRCVQVACESAAVDVPEDIPQAEAALRRWPLPPRAVGFAE